MHSLRPLTPLLGIAAAVCLLGCLNPSGSSRNEDDPMALSRAAAADSAAKHGKREVCHIPPGNPENAHTIVVGIAAVSAHLAHGDSLGVCDRVGVVPDCGKGPGKNGGKPGDVVEGPNGPKGGKDSTTVGTM